MLVKEKLRYQTPVAVLVAMPKIDAHKEQNYFVQRTTNVVSVVKVIQAKASKEVNFTKVAKLKVEQTYYDVSRKESRRKGM